LGKAVYKIEDGRLVVKPIPNLEEVLNEPPCVEIALEEFHKHRKELSKKAET
jgi:hypothetical protein